MSPSTRMLIDHYELCEHLSDGGYASVHRAIDLYKGREVVVKVPLGRTRTETTLRRRWDREMTLLGKLDHPGIVRRWDTGERHTQPYVVMEYAGGGDLRTWMKAAPGGVTAVQAAHWGKQLAEALAYLHKRGIAHCDVRPEHIMVSSDLALKLGHFALARFTDGRRRWRRIRRLPVAQGDVWDRSIFASEYLSPEESAGYVPDERTDVYNWGLVMFEMLTGSLGNNGVDRLAALAALTGGNHAGPDEMRCPPKLGGVVARALRSQPDIRIADGQALVEALRGTVPPVPPSLA